LGWILSRYERLLKQKIWYQKIITHSELGNKTYVTK
jgi:hypothetical protein